MQNIEKYQIINEKELEFCRVKSKLCILSFKLKPDIEKIKELIKANSGVQFWMAVPNMNKDDIIFANQAGIKNVLPYPIDENIIDKYLEGLKVVKQNPEENNVYPKILSEMKVMIVDDNALNIELLEETLKDFGANLEVYTQPQNAIEQINSNHFDIFLLDILMPEISGFDIAHIIKNSKLNADSPIVFISALSDYEYKISGYDAGACLYIEKPFDVEIVKRQLFNILQKEKQKKQHNQSKDQFLAMITHDLKTPISAEITALQLLLRKNLGELSESQQEIVSDILASAKFLKTMTDNILCSYKQNNTKPEFHLEECDFITLITSCINETQYLLKDKEIRLVFETKLAHASVIIDTIEIKRVINNLIGNAADYAPIGSTITITFQKLNNEYIFSITDKGAGIKLENPNDIFDCYTTLAKENKRIGFGLGLFISKNIIQNHGGRIFAENTSGQGTTITFTLPI